MIYYAVAMVLTLLLTSRSTTVYSLADGATTHRFRNAKIAFLALLPLTVISVIRWDVGVDTIYGYNYWDSLQKAYNWNNVRNFEPGFFILTAIISKLNISFWGYLTIIALIFMSCVSYAISRGSVWTKWSILVFFLLYVYFDSFNSLRQTLAEAISMIAWAKMGHQSPSRKKDLQILGLFLLALTFHTTAMLNIPIYFICKFRFNRNNLLLFAGLAVLLTPVLQLVLTTAMRLFAGQDYTFVGFALINSVMTGVLFLFCWYFHDNICALGPQAYMYTNLSLCIFILILNSGAMFLPYRVFDMLKIGYMFIIPYLLKSLKRPRVRICMEVILFVILAAWFINAFFIQDSAYVPYQTIFIDFLRIIQLP